MFALGNIRFEMGERFVWAFTAALKGLRWPFAAARNGDREVPLEASTELDAVLRYDIGLSDINVAKIHRRPFDPMAYSCSVEGMCQRLP